MTLPYGFAKAKIIGDPWIKASRLKHETQYHLHADLDVAGEKWDVAINIGTDDSDDLLQYKIVLDYHHPITEQLAAAAAGRNDLTDTAALPALDFQRSDVLAETGAWRPSDVMDGSDDLEPAKTVTRLLRRAKANGQDVYIFGRFYKEGNGIHDVHMNQGSTKQFLHRPDNDRNDHNDIWQDGGLLIDLGTGPWGAYFSAFQQQYVPTDDLGNPVKDAKPVG